MEFALNALAEAVLQVDKEKQAKAANARGVSFFGTAWQALGSLIPQLAGRQPGADASSHDMGELQCRLKDGREIDATVFWTQNSPEASTITLRDLSDARARRKPDEGLALSDAIKCHASLVARQLAGFLKPSVKGSQVIPPPPPRPLSILVVEDHASMRESLQMTLERLGHRVRGVPGAAQALMNLSGGQSYELVISDLGLPFLDGAALCRVIRSRHASMSTLIITGDTQHRPFWRDLMILRKPFDLAELSDSIAALTPPKLGAAT